MSNDTNNLGLHQHYNLFEIIQKLYYKHVLGQEFIDDEDKHYYEKLKELSNQTISKDKINTICSFILNNKSNNLKELFTDIKNNNLDNSNNNNLDNSNNNNLENNNLEYSNQLTSNNIFEDLEFFTSNSKLSKTPSYYDIINKTNTLIGNNYFKLILQNPLDNINILSNRQDLVKYFLLLDDGLKLDLVKKIVEYKNYEDNVFWNFNEKSEEFTQLLDTIYFNKFWSKFVNKRDDYLNLYYYFMILVVPIWSALGYIVMLIIPFLFQKYILKLPITLDFYIEVFKDTISGGKVFSVINILKKGLLFLAGNNTESGKYKIISFILDSLKSNIARIIYTIVIIGAYIWGVYNTILTSINYKSNI